MKLYEAINGVGRSWAIWVKPNAQGAIHSSCYAAVSSRPEGDAAIMCRGFQLYRPGKHHQACPPASVLSLLPLARSR